MNTDKILLKKICKCYSPVGREQALRNIIEAEIKDYVDEIKIDAIGNLIARKKGNGRKVMFAAHMDQSCIMVTRAEEDNLRFSITGDLSPQVILGQRVVFADGSEGCICADKDVDLLGINASQMHIYPFSEGVSSGDMGVIKASWTENGSNVICGGLNNYAGCYALVEAVKSQAETDCDVYCCFTVQEHLGYKGAKVAGYEVNPDVGIIVGSVPTSDSGKAIVSDVILGKGACLKVKERFMITDMWLKDVMTEAAEKNQIKYQYEILDMVGTGSTAIQYAHDGVLTGGISVPVKYMNTANEVVDTKDIEACIELIIAVLKELNL